MVKKLWVPALIASIIFIQDAAMAEDGGLWRLAEKKGYIKVFVNQPVNESGQGFIADNIKKALESALVHRKSVKFELTKAPEESDVRVDTVIKKFMYMEKGPLKPTPGIGTTLLDAASTMTDNYAEISIDFTVTEPGTGKILWKETLSPYIKKKMEPMESIPLISEKVAGHFVWKCFGKPS